MAQDSMGRISFLSAGGMALSLLHRHPDSW